MANSNAQKRWFHYTTFFHLPRIIKAGFIKPADGKVPKHERPAVWFSCHPVWEQTCNKMIGRNEFGDQASTHELFGLARIEVPEAVASVTWLQFTKTSGADRRTLRCLEDSALGVGSNANYWRVCYDPVPFHRWSTIEMFHSGSWIPFDEALLAAENKRREEARQYRGLIAVTRDDLVAMGRIKAGDRGI